MNKLMIIYKAYYYIANKILSQGLVKAEDIVGKRILLVGDNNVAWHNEETSCEYLRKLLLGLGAKECMVFGLLNGYKISAERLGNEDFFYGDLNSITEVLKDQEKFDTIIVLEGLERVDSFCKAAADIKHLAAREGSIYVLARTTFNVTGGPDAMLVWYEDLWRYEPETVSALFQADAPEVQILTSGNYKWLFISMKNLSSSDKLFGRRITMYSCQAGARIYEDQLKSMGYFRDTGLEALGRREVTDKSYYVHNYLSKYEHFLKKFRDERFTLLELGVYEGASERMWRDYFQQAQIVGVDIDPECKQYEDERIHIEIADLGKDETLQQLRDYRPAIIVDDASHLWSHQIKALFALFDVLPSGGIYICEDMETAANAEQYPGFDDCQIDSYTVCERVIRVVMSKTPCKEGPCAEEITRIGMATEMAAVVKGSCIFVKR